MRRFKGLIGLLLLLFTFNTMFANDIDILYDRYWNISINNPSQSTVDSYLALLNSDGSFSDLDYTSTTADLSSHLNRLSSFGGAYQTIGNTFYHSADLKSKYYTSLQFWITKNHTPSNWWYRYIRYPKTFGPCLFLMNAELQAEKPTLFNNAINYLRWAYQQNLYLTGANGADQVYGVYPSAILTDDDALLKEYQQKIKDLILVQNNGEGIEVDWMFGQHSDYGRQLYANYEHEYLNSILRLLDLSKETIYDVSDTEIAVLDNHFIHGNQWYVYKQHMDPCQTGRKPTSALNGKYARNLNLLIGLNTPNKEQLLLVKDRINNDEDAASMLTGNRMFWRFDYMIHRRENYFVSSRTTSTRTVGMESGNGEGIYNYYGGAGLNFIFRTGEEYSGNYFDIMNYRQWPGITVEQDNATLALVDWGNGGSNGNAFAGGVSDDEYGAIGTVYDRRGVEAYKSWFYFDDEYIALGTGISQSTGTTAVFTTLNQALQKSIITYAKNNTQQTFPSASGIQTVSNLDWVLQDKIGYLNLLPTSIFKIGSESRNNTSVFTLGVDHGTNPNDAAYAYAVYPDTDATSMVEYKDKTPIKILSNTKTVQAVYHYKLKIMQAIFYTSGSLTLIAGNKLTVDAPCAIMIKDTAFTYQISLANPLCETSNPASILITMDTELTGTDVVWDGSLSTLDIAITQGDYAGQSISKTVHHDNYVSDLETTEKESIDIQIYPNPAKQFITVSRGKAKVKKLEIVSLNGQGLVLQELTEDDYNPIRLDISTISKGLYILKVYTDNGIVCKKIIKN